MLLLRLKNNLIFVIPVILIILFSGCGLSKKTPASDNETIDSTLDTLNKTSFLELASEYFVEGNAALRKGDSETALRFFETAYMLDTNSEILYNKVIDVSVAAKKPAIALKMIRRGRDYSQISDDELRKIASVYLNSRLYPQAFEAIETINEKTKTDTVFLVRLSMAENLAINGTLYNARGIYDSALISLNKVLELGIKTPNILFELGMANERVGNYKEAEKYFKEVLLDNPRNSMFAITANYLGYMWADKDTNIVEAEQLILMALKEEPANGAYLDSYGWVLFKLGRYPEALRQLLLSEEQIKDDYVVYYHLGEVYLQLGDKEKALDNFNKANTFESNPDFEKIKSLIDSISKE